MVVFLFAGYSFIPEEEDDFDDEIKKTYLKGTADIIKDFPNAWEIKYSDSDATLIRSGKFKSYSGLDKEYELIFEEFEVPSR